MGLFTSWGELQHGPIHFMGGGYSMGLFTSWGEL